MEDKPNYYAVIPADVRYDEDLRANAKLLYGEITALANKTGICYASNNYFARLYKVDPSAISKWVKDLQDKEYIIIDYLKEKESIKSRIIKIKSNAQEVLPNVNRVLPKEQEGYCQKNKENNTSINNIYINNNKKEIYKEKSMEIIKATINYLNEKTGKNYKYNTPNTVKHLQARINEGYNDWDFMDVVDIKCDEWLGTDMEKYLRPDTLFGSKFENYINQGERNEKNRIWYINETSSSYV